MPLRELNLIVDKDSGRLVQSFTSTLQAQPLKFVIGDAIPVSVRVVTADPNGVWQEVDLTDQSIRLAIGTPSSSPTAGVWTITYGGDETSDLDYNASASAVETALNALSSITSAGGVTVTKSTNGAYRVIFDSAGARTDFSTDLAELYPSTESFVAEAVTGDGSTREVVLIKLETQPAAYVDLTTNLPVAAATITTVRDGGADVSEIQTLTLDPAPYAGTFTITIDGEESGAIEWDATNAEIKAAIEALASIGTDKVTVTGALPSITVEFDASLTNVAAMTADVTGLTVPTGRKGEINTNTTGIVELLDGSSQTSATFEIEIFDTNESTAFTVVQTSCTVLDDVIGNTPTSQTPLPTYLSSGNSIVYDPDITGLTGGTSADLDAIPTTELDAGRMQAVNGSDEVYIYVLATGVGSEDSPYTILPDDYDAVTNAKRWVLTQPWATTSADPFSLVRRDATGGNVIFSADDSLNYAMWATASGGGNAVRGGVTAGSGTALRLDAASGNVFLMYGSSGEYFTYSHDGTFGLDTTSKESLLAAIGIPVYADLTAANAALNAGDIYYDQALSICRAAIA